MWSDLNLREVPIELIPENYVCRKPHIKLIHSLECYKTFFRALGIGEFTYRDADYFTIWC